MNTKRITMGIMTCCLAASLLAGCGGAGDSSGSGEKGGAKSTATAKVTFPAREAT